MSKPIDGIDFAKLLKRLSDDIVFAPAFLRLDKQLTEHFAGYEAEVIQAPYFWSMVGDAVREAGLTRLTRIYDQESSALSLRTLLTLIEANKALFDHKAVKTRLEPVNPSFAQSIAPDSHLPDPLTLARDLELVSVRDPLVYKMVLWRNNFGAHISSKQTIRQSVTDAMLPTQDEAFKLCKRAFEVFNRYTSLFHAVHHSELIMNEEGSVATVFKYLRAGLIARRKEADEETERLLAALKVPGSPKRSVT